MFLGFSMGLWVPRAQGLEFLRDFGSGCLFGFDQPMVGDEHGPWLILQLQEKVSIMVDFLEIYWVSRRNVEICSISSSIYWTITISWKWSKKYRREIPRKFLRGELHKRDRGTHQISSPPKKMVAKELWIEWWWLVKALLRWRSQR